jgi:hypothetical protein
MAKPIEPTPILKGQDAKNFLDRMNRAKMTPERLEWLQSLAEQSKRAESK